MTIFMHHPRKNICVRSLVFLLVCFALVYIFPIQHIDAADEASAGGSFTTPLSPSTPDTTIFLTKDGFSPQTLTISQGTTVTFKTTTGKYFWPASNDHPTHDIYPEFDPKEPIAPNSEWQFRFGKVGSWGYHDHISPLYTGVVHVTGENSGPVGLKQHIFLLVQSVKEYLDKFIAQNMIWLAEYKCRSSSLGRDDKIVCWENVVKILVRRRGLNAAFAFVDRERVRDVFFASDCHVYVHRIGEEYYWQFIKSRKIEVSSKFGICDLGFFHGFMQEFTSHGQDVTAAKKYCDVVAQTIHTKQNTDELLSQCYHGIGHGLAYMYAPLYWGDMPQIFSHGIADCKRVLHDPASCISGVYGGVAAMYWGLHGYSLTMDLSDPFAVCRGQKMPDIAGCYNQMVPVLFGASGLNVAKAGKIMQDIISDQGILDIVMEHLGSMPSHTMVPKTSDFSSVIYQCRELTPHNSVFCIAGFGGSLMRIGSFYDGTKRAVDFCRLPILSDVERAKCYRAIELQIIPEYSESQVKIYCRKLEEETHEKICADIH